MLRKFAWFTLSVLLFAPPLSAQQGKEFFFQKGDRVVFLGDSITEQYQYSSYIELYLTTRFPQWNMSFINTGIGGDTAGGGAGRFQKHVLDEKPTAVTINFGMNDGGYGAFNPGSNKNFIDKTRTMLNLAKKANVRVGLLSPNAVDRRVQERFKLYVETQQQFYAPLKDLASANGATFVDQYAVELDAARWEELICSLEAFGNVHVIVSNGAATLEAVGQFGGFSTAGVFFNVQTDSLDMHMRWQELGAIFAVEKPSHLEGKNTFSFQFFDRSGNAAFKVFLNFGGAISSERAQRFTQMRDGFRMKKK